jgi:hypothetical protein
MNLPKVKSVDHGRVFNSDHWFLFYCPVCSISVERTSTDTIDKCKQGHSFLWPEIPNEKKKIDHVYFKCDCWKTGCMFCDGGLGACTVCMGIEGSLTTECCGRPITEAEELLIYNRGILDFRNGEWVYKPNYTRYYK